MAPKARRPEAEELYAIAVEQHESATRNAELAFRAAAMDYAAAPIEASAEAFRRLDVAARLWFALRGARSV